MSKTTEHKEGKATVKIYYKVSKTLADGSHPFQIRVTKDRKQIFRSTGLSLHPDYWNPKKQEIRKSYPDPDRENLVQDLEKWRKKYADVANNLAAKDEQHDAETVISKVRETRQATRRVKLLAYCSELADQYKATGRIGNATIYRDLRNQLAKFISDEYFQKDIPFERVTVAFCNEWENTLRATEGITAETTLSLRFRTLRAVLNKAIAAGLAQAEHYPFSRTEAERHKFQVGKFNVNTKKRALPREAVRRLENLLPATERHRRAKEIFTFAFYAGGMSFVDLAQLRWRDLSGQHPETGHPERVEYKREKTKRKKSGQELTVRLLGPAAAIVAAYRPITYNGPESYVFPILDLATHVTPTQIKNRLHKILGQVNDDLKELGELAGITTPLTTYVARHSFATTLKQAGKHTAVISQAMGHSSEAVTSVYLESFASELVDEAFDALL